MNYKIFYADYCEGKFLEEAIEATLDNILHSMDCVLHVPDNFFGIINNNGQVLQFVVENDHSVTIDIPILENGTYVYSKGLHSNINDCLNLVRELSLEQDFYTLLPEDKLFINELVND